MLVVYAIVALGEALPALLNNYAFMFLTVSALAAKAGDPKPFLWLAIELAGGVALIGGIVIIGKVMALHTSLVPLPEQVAEG